MAITTTSSIVGLNPQSQSVLNYMAGARTNEQIIGEFFGLRKEAVYNDAGDKVIDMINDFKDSKALRLKGVCYTERFKDFLISEEDFYKIIDKEYVETKRDSTSTGSIKK